VVIGPDAIIGSKCKIQNNVSVYKGVTLEDGVFCGHTIGCYAFIGTGAVVTKDVPDHALMAGNPAKNIGNVCICGERDLYDR